MIASSDAEIQTDMIEPIKKVHRFQHHRRNSRSCSGSTTDSTDGSLQSVSQQSSVWRGFDDEVPIDLDSVVLPEAHSSSGSTGPACSRESSVDSFNDAKLYPDPYQGYRGGDELSIILESRSNSACSDVNEIATSHPSIISLGDLAESSRLDSESYPNNQ